MNIEKQHEVSHKMIKKLITVAYKQDEFGMKKYKEPLNHMQQYDWLAMFFEEMADGLKYIQCEIDRKLYVVELLKRAKQQGNVEDMKSYVEVALDLLSVEGTGK